MKSKLVATALVGCIVSFTAYAASLEPSVSTSAADPNETAAENLERRAEEAQRERDERDRERR